MLKHLKLILAITLNLFIALYLFFSIESTNVNHKTKIQGLIGFSIIVILSMLSVIIGWLKFVPKNLLIIQIYYFFRIILLITSIYLIFGNKFLTLNELLIGYLLLLLNSFISIKNEKHL